MADTAEAARVHCIRCTADLPRNAFYASSLGRNIHICTTCTKNAARTKPPTPAYARLSRLAMSSRNHGASDVSVGDVRNTEMALGLKCLVSGKTWGVVLARCPALLSNGAQVRTRGLYLPLYYTDARALNQMLDRLAPSEDADAAARAENGVALVFFGADGHARLCARFAALPDAPVEHAAKRARIAVVGD